MFYLINPFLLLILPLFLNAGDDKWTCEDWSNYLELNDNTRPNTIPTEIQRARRGGWLSAAEVNNANRTHHETPSALASQENEQTDSLPLIPLNYTAATSEEPANEFLLFKDSMRFLIQIQLPETPSLDTHERPGDLLNEAPPPKITRTSPFATIDLTAKPRTVEVPFIEPLKKTTTPLTRCKPQEQPSENNNSKPGPGNNQESYKSDWQLPSIKFNVRKIQRS